MQARKTHGVPALTAALPLGLYSLALVHFHHPHPQRGRRIMLLQSWLRRCLQEAGHTLMSMMLG